MLEVVLAYEVAHLIKGRVAAEKARKETWTKGKRVVAKAMRSVIIFLGLPCPCRSCDSLPKSEGRFYCDIMDI